MKHDDEARYKLEAAYALKTIRTRGCIWEGCRPVFESGQYYDHHLDRMLKEGVIVPSKKTDGGYVLPLYMR